MTKRITKQELQTQLNDVQRDCTVANEVIRALLRGEQPRAWPNADGQYTVWTLALDRVHGGVCTVISTGLEPKHAGVWQYVMDLAGRPFTKMDPYMRETIGKINKAHAEALDNRPPVGVPA